uniref:Uncharacterized protein n=1 Tax=Timema shepardi TaxID=629360 RepID=A0A7R9B147_TIMSH|nr:unnamed protein product [Timema shepardi]
MPHKEHTQTTEGSWEYLVLDAGGQPPGVLRHRAGPAGGGGDPRAPHAHHLTRGRRTGHHGRRSPSLALDNNVPAPAGHRPDYSPTPARLAASHRGRGGGTQPQQEGHLILFFHRGFRLLRRCTGWDSALAGRTRLQDLARLTPRRTQPWAVKERENLVAIPYAIPERVFLPSGILLVHVTRGYTHEEDNIEHSLMITSRDVGKVPSLYKANEPNSVSLTRHGQKRETPENEIIAMDRRERHQITRLLLWIEERDTRERDYCYEERYTRERDYCYGQKRETPENEIIAMDRRHQETLAWTRMTVPIDESWERKEDWRIDPRTRNSTSGRAVTLTRLFVCADPIGRFTNSFSLLANRTNAAASSSRKELSGKQFMKLTLRRPDRNSNSDLPVISRSAWHVNDALDLSATEADSKIYVQKEKKTTQTTKLQQKNTTNALANYATEAGNVEEYGEMVSSEGYIIWSGNFTKPSVVSCELSVSTKEAMGLLVHKTLADEDRRTILEKMQCLRPFQHRPDKKDDIRLTWIISNTDLAVLPNPYKTITENRNTLACECPSTRAQCRTKRVPPARPVTSARQLCLRRRPINCKTHHCCVSPHDHHHISRRPIHRGTPIASQIAPKTSTILMHGHAGRLPHGYRGPREVKEGFGNQINLCRDRGSNLGPSAEKSDTLPLDRQVTIPDKPEIRSNEGRIDEVPL